MIKQNERNTDVSTSTKLIYSQPGKLTAKARTKIVRSCQLPFSVKDEKFLLETLSTCVLVIKRIDCDCAETFTNIFSCSSYKRFMKFFTLYRRPICSCTVKLTQMNTHIYKQTNKQTYSIAH